MPAITAASVSSLRARTGVSILAVKEALEEAGGDEEKAIEILRKKGIAQAAKKAAREQSEGLVFLKEGGNTVAALQIRCETDFVARDDAFGQAGKSLVSTLLSSGKDAAWAESEKVLPGLVQKLGENITMGDVYVVEAPVIGAYLHSNAKIGVVVGLSA